MDQRHGQQMRVTRSREPVPRCVDGDSAWRVRAACFLPVLMAGRPSPKMEGVHDDGIWQARVSG